MLTTVRIRPARRVQASMLGGDDLVEGLGRHSVEIMVGGHTAAIYRIDTAEVLWKETKIEFGDGDYERLVEMAQPLMDAFEVAELEPA
jgi:hypothetical protein